MPSGPASFYKYVKTGKTNSLTCFMKLKVFKLYFSDCGLYTDLGVGVGGGYHFEQRVVRQVREATLLMISLHFTAVLWCLL